MKHNCIFVLEISYLIVKRKTSVFLLSNVIIIMQIPSNSQLLNEVQVMLLVLKTVVRVVWEKGKEGRDAP